jgi:hypothetical protein
VLSWRTSLAASVSLVCLAYAAASATTGDADPEIVTITASVNSRGHDATPFTIAVAGKALGKMYPGLTRDMALTLKNPYGFALKVTSLRGEVTASSKRKCRPTPANLVAKPYVGSLPLVVPARGEKRAGVIPLSMPWGASQDCQQAKFTIRLVGTATKADR